MSNHETHNKEDKMINVKIYLPLQDNDGNTTEQSHVNFIYAIKCMNKAFDGSFIGGFTITEAKGYWFDGDVQYVDNQRIYEFHIEAGTHRVQRLKFLKLRAKVACFQMKQECIYMTIDNEQHFITEDK